MWVAGCIWIESIIRLFIECIGFRVLIWQIVVFIEFNPLCGKLKSIYLALSIDDDDFDHQIGFIEYVRDLQTPKKSRKIRSEIKKGTDAAE